MNKKLLCLVLLMNISNLWSADSKTCSPESLQSISDEIIRIEEENKRNKCQLDKCKKILLSIPEKEFDEALRYVEDKDLRAFLVRSRQAPVRKKLFQAIQDYNIKQVNEILRKNPEAINFQGKNGCTPLIKLARIFFDLNNFENRKEILIAKILLKKGAEINSNDDNGWTPLMFAASSGKMNLVKLFLENSANKFVKTNSENSTATSLAQNKIGMSSRNDEKFKSIAEYIEGYTYTIP